MCHTYPRIGGSNRYNKDMNRALLTLSIAEGYPRFVQTIFTLLKIK